MAGSSPARTAGKESANDRVARTITRIVNSMWFLYGFVLFIGLWMEFSPRMGWDTAPQYPVMLYWVNLFQAVMLPVLAVGQSVISRQNRRRQDVEFETVQKIDRVLHLVENQVRTIGAEIQQPDERNPETR